MSGLNERGGCSVDWSWLRGEEIDTVENGLDELVVRFKSGLEWRVRALLWRGAPFLAFAPHEKPR